MVREGPLYHVGWVQMLDPDPTSMWSAVIFVIATSTPPAAAQRGFALSKIAWLCMSGRGPCSSLPRRTGSSQPRGGRAAT